MTRERVALLAFDQNLHLQNARNVGGERLNERGDCELLGEHAGAVPIGEGSVDVDDGEARVDKIDAANFRPDRQRVRGRLVEI